MNIVDLILLIVLFLFGLRGYFKGLFRETFSLAGLIAGFVVAARYSERVAMIGEGYWQISPLILKGISFVAVFFVVYFFLSLIGWLLHRSANVLFLQTLNRGGGIAVGVGKGIALLALAAYFAGAMSWAPRAAKDKFESSVLVPPLSHLGDGMVRIGKERLMTIEPRRT